MLCKSRFTPYRNTVSRDLFVSFYRRLRHLAFTLQLNRAVRFIGPTIVALSFAGVAHAQGTMDFSGAQTLMGTFKTYPVVVAVGMWESRRDSHTLSFPWPVFRAVGAG
jgi:hypothetical protein